MLIFNLYEYDTFRYASESKFKCENENYPVTSNRNGSDSWDIAKFSRKRKKILSLFTISMIFENLQRVKWTLFICQRGTLSRLKDYYLREVVCSVSENLFVIRPWEIFEILNQSPKIGYRSFWPGGLLGLSFGPNLAKRNRVPRNKVQVQCLAKWKCRPGAIFRHQMSAKSKVWPSGNVGHVQKMAKCYYDKFVFKNRQVNNQPNTKRFYIGTYNSNHS